MREARIKEIRQLIDLANEPDVNLSGTLIFCLEECLGEIIRLGGALAEIKHANRIAEEITEESWYY